jgi:hypothetical protein
MSFIRRGKTNLWMDFLRERNRIVAETKADEIAADKAKAKRKQEIDEVVEMVLLVALIALVVTTGIWGTMEYIAFMRR